VKNTLRTGSFILKLIDLFDEALCRKLLFDLVRGPICRNCRKSIPERHLERFYAGKEIYCRQCNSKFFAVGGTVLAQTKLSYKQILKILVRLDMKFKTKQIATAGGVDPHTIARWRHKLTELKNG
jgi:DNA-directed RNA polymerase subunit RPC12/RpoP